MSATEQPSPELIFPKTGMSSLKANCDVCAAKDAMSMPNSPNSSDTLQSLHEQQLEAETGEQNAQRIRAIEKENRILKKKLKRSENDRVYLERNYEVRESMLNQVVQELEKAQVAKEQQNQELNEALHKLRMMQTKLVEAEKMSALGVLVAGVAHEINNPISFIHGNVEIANTYLSDLVALIQLYQQHYPEAHADIVKKQQDIDFDFLVDDVFDLLQSMQIGSDRIREIVLSLRTFSRHDESAFKDADIHEGLDSTLMILQHQLKENGNDAAIQIKKNYGNLPPIACFAGQLNQVFMNILSNAIDALRDGDDWLITEQTALDVKGNPQPTIWIETCICDQKNLVSVTIGNNGVPIPEPVRDRLFEPFFTTKAIGKGTGLGLSISYQIIVDRHHGQLTCSSSFQRGTAFVIDIPFRALSYESVISSTDGSHQIG